MSLDLDHQKAIENSSIETVAYLEQCRAMSGKQLLDAPDEMTFEMGFRIFTRLSLLVTRRRPEIAVHCVLIHIMPMLQSKQITAIKRSDINKIINGLVLDGKIVQSRRVFSVMKQFLSWCEFQGHIDTSPLASISLNKVAGGVRMKPRERILSDEEINLFWTMWDLADVDDCTKWAARLILCSARRPDEVLRARRSEFDLDRDVWNQGTRNKSARRHTLPISPIMRECIESLFLAGGNSEWLVPSKRREGNPVSKVLISQASRRIQGLSYSGFNEPFEIRDLRRTARSAFSRLKISQEVARQIMNHSPEGLDNVYNKHDYLDEMAEAMLKYSTFLRSCIKG